MWPWVFVLLQLCCVHQALFGRCTSAQLGVPNSTRSTWDAMYREQRHVGGCYLLLNATGKTGSTGEHVYVLAHTHTLTHTHTHKHTHAHTHTHAYTHKHTYTLSCTQSNVTLSLRAGPAEQAPLVLLKHLKLPLKGTNLRLGVPFILLPILLIDY